MNLRAFSLEMACRIAIDDWAWEIKESSCILGPRAMIEIILTRCDDVSPTVRLRAVSAIFDLLRTIQAPNEPTALSALLLQFAIGDTLRTMKSPSSGGEDTKLATKLESSPK